MGAACNRGATPARWTKRAGLGPSLKRPWHGRHLLLVVGFIQAPCIIQATHDGHRGGSQLPKPLCHAKVTALEAHVHVACQSVTQVLWLSAPGTFTKRKPNHSRTSGGRPPICRHVDSKWDKRLALALPHGTLKALTSAKCAQQSSKPATTCKIYDQKKWCGMRSGTLWCCSWRIVSLLLLPDSCQP